MDFKFDGFDELQRKLDRAAKAASPRETARRIRATCFPVHGEAPTNVRVVGNETKAEFCREKARDLAMNAATDPIKKAFG